MLRTDFFIPSLLRQLNELLAANHAPVFGAGSLWYPASGSRLKFKRVKSKRFWIDTRPKNRWFKKRVHKLGFHLPARMVTTDRKIRSGGSGLKKMSRNCGV